MSQLRSLIGFSGFVGQSLLKQTSFNQLYRSNNSDEAGRINSGLVVCCAAPGQKWFANSNPQEDLRSIEKLIAVLQKIKCENFVLISTIDVFSNPVNLDETKQVDPSGLHPYGLHRFWLEEFVREKFDSSHVIRLPGLVGPGLRKNALYDLLNFNNLDLICPEDQFQFYPIVNLWPDIQSVVNKNIHLAHLTAEPLSVAEILKSIPGREIGRALARPAAKYDVRSIYAEMLGNQKNYTYRKSESLIAIRSYFQSEAHKKQVV